MKQRRLGAITLQGAKEISPILLSINWEITMGAQIFSPTVYHPVFIPGGCQLKELFYRQDLGRNKRIVFLPGGYQLKELFYKQDLGRNKRIV